MVVVSCTADPRYYSMEENMKYQIFELIPKSRLEPDGYYTKTLLNYTLEQDAYPDLYVSFDAAVSYIRENPDEFKSQKLTVLPILDVDYKGKIKGIGDE